MLKTEHPMLTLKTEKRETREGTVEKRAGGHVFFK